MLFDLLEMATSRITDKIFDNSARFLIMYEYENCGGAIKNALKKHSTIVPLMISVLATMTASKEKYCSVCGRNI